MYVHTDDTDPKAPHCELARSLARRRNLENREDTAAALDGQRNRADLQDAPNRDAIPPRLLTHFLRICLAAFTEWGNVSTAVRAATNGGGDG
jgi:hypothetical protein